MSRRLIASFVLVMAAACACGPQSTTAGHAPASTGATAALIAAADLKPCPSSSTTAVSGGLPNVTLNCLGNGPAVHMAGLTGKPTVVNVWGSWCTPCQKEERYLSTAYDALHGKVRFLGVDSVDLADSALSFDAHVSPPVHFPSVFDPDRKVLIGLHFSDTPYTVFVSSDGKVVGKNTVPYTTTAAVERDISRYLHVST